MSAVSSSTSPKSHSNQALNNNGAQPGNSALALCCSGSDAQGMNAAVRAVVRMGIHSGYNVFFIKEGYKGLVEGGVNIEKADWDSVTGIIQQGGTIIGSDSNDKFQKDKEARKKAALNLVTHEPPITNLVCIGGEGCLAGANVFLKDWSSLIAELFKKSQITLEQKECCAHLNVVCLGCSIYNNFCDDTDMTIGADSALHRITEAIDSIATTANSHQRCFVLEVMGRDCGYLALVSAMACEADWLFIPECPPKDDWEEALCKKLDESRSQRVHIIVVAEGAVDSRKNNFERLSVGKIQNVIKKKLPDFDTRSTVLGHIQRGGAPSAFDRILATRMGAEAVLALKESKPGTPACLIALESNHIKRVELSQVVKSIENIKKAMKDRKNSIKEHVLDRVIKPRGQTFENNFEIYKKLSKPITFIPSPETTGYNLGVVHIGASAGGMNAATRAFVRKALLKGHIPWGIYKGLEGLVAGEGSDSNDKVRNLTWSEVYGWNSQGGSNLGCSRSTAEKVGLKRVANALRRYNLHGLLLIGGFDAFQTAAQLIDGRSQHPEFSIPICLIPATISNNVPGTDFSLGSDTALNEIVNLCDRIKQSDIGTKRRVFVVETMGGYCGYLASMAGIAGAADAVYIFEEKFKIKELVAEVEHLRAKIEGNVQCGLILRNERASENYTTDFIEKLYSEESNDVYTCCSNILGHAQQGGMPSTFDRLYGTKLASQSIAFFERFLEGKLDPSVKVSTPGDDSAVLIGIVKRDILSQKISELKETADPEHHMPKAETQWWMRLRPLLRIYAHHTDSPYKSEAEEEHT